MTQKTEFNKMFKKVSIRRKGHSSVAADAVRLLKSRETGPLSRFAISKELSEELPWLENDKLDLYQASKNLFALVPSTDGNLLLKAHRNKNSKYKSFQIYNTDLCNTLKSITKATEFSGWVDDNKLFFKTN